MYELIMYGSVILGDLSILVMGIMLVALPADKLKIKLKPGQSRDSAVKRVRRSGRVCIILSVAVVVMIGYGFINYQPYI